MMSAAMSTLVTIGDFSRMSHLSVKALRHYHEAGLLEPAEVDPGTGYRRYEVGQVTTAQVIRRFRDLGMPLDEVRAVLRAPDATARNKLIVAHLERMEAQLEQSQANVASLRALLERPPAEIAVEYRAVPAIAALGVADRVEASDVERWWSQAFDALYAELAARGVEPAGPGGALYPSELFETEQGEVVAYVPVHGELPDGGGVRALELPAAELAVALHEGAFAELDRTYGALGTFVAEREIGLNAPIREHYLVSARDTPDERRHRTEVCWPVFRTAPGRRP
jgi:DNA-binding transcriptional MerR regulator